MTNDTYKELTRNAGCVFEERGRPCGKAVEPHTKFCPRHGTLMAAQSDRLANKTASTRRSR